MSKPRLPHALIAAASALALGLTLCSCASEGGTGPTGRGTAISRGDDAPGMTMTDTNPQPRTALRQGGTLVWAIDQFSTQWNPLHTDGSESSTNDVMKALLPTLWRSDAGGTQTPNKAYLRSAELGAADGKQTVTWTLNPAAHWSDGKPITWLDLQATWRAQSGRDKAYQAGSTTGFDQVERVERGKDDFQAVMTFKTPFSEWQSMYNNAANSPLLPAAYASTPELFNTSFVSQIPVSGGPFKLQTLDRSAKTVTVVADPAWWGDKPLLDRIVFKAVDTGAMPKAFAEGQVDFFNNGPSAEGYKQILATPDGEARRAGGPNLRMMVLNAKRPPLDDAAVRRAIFQAVDREAITRTDLAGLDWPYTPMNNHFLVPGQNGYQDNSDGLSRYDPSAASAALQDAGWRLGAGSSVRTKDGKPLELHLVIPAANPLAASEGKLITQMLAKVGVQIDVTPVVAGDFFAKYVYPHDFDLTAFALLGTPFPATNGTSTFQQGSGSNYAQTGSDALDRAMAAAAAADSPETEAAALNRADAEAWQVAGMVPLYQRPAVYGVRKTVANLGAPGLSDVVYENIGFQR
ncbi:Putative ABC transporter substrate-binding protein [Kitasatospora sp. MMS16-BH015]|uniref:ABC transporter family substrate-binding protein n=1 Tax=Kitasatospora sp. MMS16-BH015 TaxID=2018025 RepID=UPI000CA2A3CC|nr:ABC transporter family substrate-binding protein [Kitasatospora sp. MMS16-BH015]AUG79509.1 Putative ABC transporter substrate-binding protein [Kitasatospora sp. MMS16-BH015]